MAAKAVWQCANTVINVLKEAETIILSFLKLLE
jgi:hypothetical protein